MKNLKLTIAVLVFMATYFNMLSQNSSQLSIQGVLRNANGTAVENGKYDITFRLWDAATNGNQIWIEEKQDVDVEGGIYSVVLGDGATRLDASFTAQYFLGVSIEGGTELIPRAPLTSSPYALSLIGNDNVFPNSGNVGVGSSDPQSKLTVKRGTGVLGLDAEEEANRNTTITSKATGLEYYSDGTNTAHVFTGENGETMRITTSGKVGIGTNDPQNTLHVIGADKQIKVEGTDNANITFTKSSGSASLGFDAANGNNLSLSNPIGETRIVGNQLSLNPTIGKVMINGAVESSGAIDLNVNGNALNLTGTDSSYINFDPDGPSGSLAASIGISSVSNSSYLRIKSESSDIILSPKSAGVVRVNELLYATGARKYTLSNFVLEYMPRSTYANRPSRWSGDFSIYASKGIRAPWFAITSDKRIKKDFIRSDKAQDLATLSQLQVTDYRHIDEVQKGKQYRKGLIAQEVMEVFPEAVTTSADFIPDVYAFPTQLELKDDLLTIHLEKEHDLIATDKIKIITKKGEEQFTVSKVLDGKTFTITKWEGNANKEELFIYGKEVPDFHTVDYDRVFTLAVSATQELARKVEALEKENAILKTKSAEASQSETKFQADINDLTIRLQKMETLLFATGSK